MKEDEMRRIVFTSVEGDRVMDKLADLPTWKMTQGEGGCRLVKGGTQIYLSERAPNVVYTCNVLPFDVTGDQEGAKKELTDLLNEVDTSSLDGVQADLAHSDRDLVPDDQK
ncbi:hypothetical protein [Burkholderia gladioli]|uniref:hypothetical protein n=1 Tax=Burkholderia gladioli TaxID=28095 RepID=UPI0034DAEEE9